MRPETEAELRQAQAELLSAVERARHARRAAARSAEQEGGGGQVRPAHRAYNPGTRLIEAFPGPITRARQDAAMTETLAARLRDQAKDLTKHAARELSRQGLELQCRAVRFAARQAVHWLARCNQARRRLDTRHLAGRLRTGRAALPGVRHEQP
jgi:hypothetical protein